MAIRLRYLFSICLLASASLLHAQTWPSPEVGEMYNDARNFMSSGNLQQAIALFQQAIQLAPDQMVLHRELGRAYYMSGNYNEAKATLEPLINSGEADEQSYQAMAACLSLSGDKKKAKTMLQKGIEKYPHSGLLFHDMGKLYEDENENVYALETWLDGIQADPAYHVNYYEAAKTYMNTDKLIWGIIYGEIFVNIERQTPRADEMRQSVFDAYKTLFATTLNPTEVPKFSKGKKAENVAAGSFEEAVRNTYLKLSPVVSDGITAENLTMLRARFAIEWASQYSAKYPFALFDHYNLMLRSGFFDIYNEWLFGKAESVQLFESWKVFHNGDMPKFDTWAQANALHPAPTDFYNDKQVDGIFSKKKK